jgi:hypothetical protein
MARELIRSKARRKRIERSQNALERRVTRPLAGQRDWDGGRDQKLGSLVLLDHQFEIDRGPTSNSYDPFNALPVDKRGNAHYILSQCTSCFLGKKTPFRTTAHPRGICEDLPRICAVEFKVPAALHVYILPST